MYEQAEATKATALPAAYHVPDHRVTPSVLHEKHLLSEAARLSWSSFMRPFVIAGLYSGLLSFMFVLTFNEISGYDWPGRGGLGKVMTSYFGSMVFGHIGVGLALAYCARKLSRTTDQRRFFRSFMLFLPPLFLLTFYVRQLFVSSGWLVSGRDAAGVFGKPDLETTAIAMAFCLCIGMFLMALRRAPPLSGPARLLQATIISLSCGTVFFAISTAYNILVTEGMIDPEGFFLSPAVFSFRFPHPERLPLICFMIFVQIYFTLTLVAGYFQRRSG